MFKYLRLGIGMALIVSFLLPINSHLSTAQEPISTYAVITPDNVSKLRPTVELAGHQSSVSSLAFSPDGNLLASAGFDSAVRIWDIETQQELMVLEGHEDRIQHLRFSPDGRQIATASRDKTARIWDAETGAELYVLANHNNDVTSLGYSSDSAYLATFGLDENIRVWDTSTGQEVYMLDNIHASSSVYPVGFTFSPDDTVIVTGAGTLNSGNYDTTGNLTIDFWDAKTGELLNTLEGHTDTVWSVLYSPNGNVIASSSRDSTIRLWEATTGEPLFILDGHTDEVRRSIGFSPDESLLASASKDKSLYIWDVTTGESIANFESRSLMESLAFSPVGNIIATGGLLGKIQLWTVDPDAEPSSEVNVSKDDIEEEVVSEAENTETVEVAEIDLGTIAIDEVITGVVAKNERRLITFTGVASDVLTIQNNSLFVFIEVYDDTTGEILIEKTDDAQIRLPELPTDGPYTIILTTESLGNYSIRITH